MFSRYAPTICTILGLLLLSLCASHGQYREEIASVQITSGAYVIASDATNGAAGYDRDTIKLTTSAEFERLASGSAGAVSYRVCFQLRDPSGSAVPLASGGGTATTVCSNAFTVNYGAVGAVVTKTGNNELTPAAPLVPNTLYHVHATLERQVGSKWLQVDSMDSSARSFLHFTSTVSGDTAPNALAEITNIEWIEHSALDTAAGTDAQSFKARITFKAYRYDGFNQGSPATTLVPFNVSYLVRELGTNAAKAVENGGIQPGWNLAQFVWQGGVRVPKVRTGLVVTVHVNPAVQLATYSKQHYLSVNVSHSEGGTTRVDGGKNGPAGTLLHFNGTLIGNTATGTIEAFETDPALAYFNASGRYAFANEITDGFVNGFPDHQLGDSGSASSPTFYLYDDGHVEMLSIGPSITPPAGPDLGTQTNLTFLREGMSFQSSGIRATVTLQLPTGLGWYPGKATASPARVYERTAQANIILNGNLTPQEDVVSFPIPSGGGYNHVALVEESKPFAITASRIDWWTTEGEIRPGPAVSGVSRVVYVRENEVEALASAPIPAADKVLFSNELLYEAVNGLGGDAHFVTDSDGVASFNGSINLSGGDFRPHFPQGARVAWTGAGSVKITDDVIDPTQSSVSNSPFIFVPYQRDCEDAVASGCGEVGDVNLRMWPGANGLTFTPDGGVVASGPMLALGGARRDLQLGYIGALSGSGDVFAHDTAPYPSGRFFMAGHFLPGGVATLDDEAPGILLNSGVDPISLATMHRPGTQAYLNGTGDYPGVNYRTGDIAGGITAVSVIGGETTPSYDLADRSKYYTRLSGVSGIHEAEAGSFPNDLDIYGYDFEFDNFSQSFLSSRVHDSATSGQIAVPFPSDFIFEFDSITFDCLGRPERTEPAGGSFETTLDYWKANIAAKSAEFRFPDASPCDVDEGFLTLGVKTFAQNIADPLFGTLAFQPDGTLLNPSVSEVEGLDSRLNPPLSLLLDGPGEEKYHFYPSQGIYFNNYALRDPSVGGGTMNFVGFLDVPFFEDMPVHFQTAPLHPSTTTAVHMMAGWEENNGGDASAETFFDSTLFDLKHRSYPQGGPTLSDYRDYDDETWRPHAKQDWLGVVAFDYPLDWSSASRIFKSSEPQGVDLMVLAAEHELTHLSPDWAEIDFGANLDLQIPEINLANIGSTVLDAALEESGVLQALVQSTSDNFANGLLNGLDAGAELVNDQTDALYDRVFAGIDGAVDALAAEIKNLEDDFSAVETEVSARLSGNADSIRAQIQALADTGAGEVGALVSEVDMALAEVQFAIRSVISYVKFDSNGDPILTAPVLVDPNLNPGGDVTAGLFANQEGIGYDLVKGLIAELIDELFAEAAANMNALAGSVTDAINEELNALLEEAEPTLEDIKQVLMQVHNAIGELRQATAMAEQLEDAFQNAATEINNTITDVETVILGFLEGIDITEFNADELSERIKEEIRDRFNATALVAQVQVILRQYMYDLQATMNEAISSAFGEVNRMLVALLTEALPDATGALNEMLGDLSQIAATANVDGYALINGDALRTLRVDVGMQLKLPDNFEFDGYLEINQLDSFGDDGCDFAGESEYAAEVKMGANNIPVAWTGEDLRFNIGGKFSFDTANNFRLRGLGGSFEMTQGEISVEAMAITDLAATAAFGLDENYLGARVGMRFDQYQMAGGVFFGRACSPEPLYLVDPDFQSVLGDTGSFTGVYTYGDAQIPIVGASCLFSLQAGVGAGIFVFEEGPTIGGKMRLAVVGKALCAVEVGGEVVLLGLKQGNDFSFLGRGRVFGSVGACDFCVSFDEAVEMIYQNNQWEYNF